MNNNKLPHGLPGKSVLLLTALLWGLQTLAQTTPVAPVAPVAPGKPALKAASARSAELGSGAMTVAAPSAAPAPALATAPAPLQPCVTVVVEPAARVTLGKSSVMTLSAPIVRMLVGGRAGGSRAGAPRELPADAAPLPRSLQPLQAGALQSDGVADVELTLLSPTELFLLGRRTGSMNLVLQSADGRCFIRDVLVTVDPASLQATLGELLPDETGVKVRGADGALVLTGQVSDAQKLDAVMSLATSHAEGRRVVNMLRLNTPQQVMLEVKIAEVSKTLLDKFGIDYARLLTSADGLGGKVISGIFGGGPAVFGQFSNLSGAALAGSANAAVGTVSNGARAALSTAGQGATLLGIDAQKKDGLIRVLAEPNIMAISGQSASFLSGGKIFIPVAQTREAGGSTITLEEKEFGVGLRFSPTVLDGTRVNLKLVSEVSELAQTGSAFTTVGGVTSVLPSITTRRVDTTVQLNDGQSFAIAGLIKNNVTESISRFPGLGDLPLFGALFRSTEFQKDQTELIFVVTPRLVKPLKSAALLPTDVHVAPNSADALFHGAAEGKSPAMTAPAPAADKAPASR
jgi:pilus assembly protein CpaC